MTPLALPEVANTHAFPLDRAERGERFVERPVDVALAGLESGLAPQRWPRRRSGLVGRTLHAVLAPPLVLGALLTSTMVLSLVVAASMTRLFAAQRMLFVVDSAFLALAGLLELGALGWLALRLRARALDERPYARARPLLVELVGQLLPWTRAEQALELTLAPRSAVRVELELHGGRRVVAGLALRRRDQVRVALELPLAAAILRDHAWPGALRSHVSALGPSAARVELTLSDDATLATELRAIGRDAARLCASFVLATLPDAEAPALVRFEPCATLPDAPHAAADTAASPLVLRNARLPASRLAAVLRMTDLVLFVSALATMLAAATTLLALEPGGSAPLVVGAALALAVTAGANLLPMPRRQLARPRAAVEPEPLRVIAERWLARGGQRIDLLTPFDLSLTREPPRPELELGTGVGIELRQQGTQLRFAVRCREDDALAELPVFEAPSPLTDARTFADAIWPRVRFYAEAHGRRVPWAASLAPLEAGGACS